MHVFMCAHASLCGCGYVLALNPPPHTYAFICVHFSGRFAQRAGARVAGLMSQLDTTSEQLREACSVFDEDGADDGRACVFVLLAAFCKAMLKALPDSEGML